MRRPTVWQTPWKLIDASGDFTWIFGTESEDTVVHDIRSLYLHTSFVLDFVHTLLEFTTVMCHEISCLFQLVYVLLSIISRIILAELINYPYSILVNMAGFWSIRSTMFVMCGTSPMLMTRWKTESFQVYINISYSFNLNSVPIWLLYIGTTNSHKIFLFFFLWSYLLF